MIGSALDLTPEVSCANLSYQHWLFQTSESAQRFSGIPFVESKPPSTSENLKAAAQHEYIGNRKRFDTQWLLLTLADRSVFLTKPNPLHG